MDIEGQDNRIEKVECKKGGGYEQEEGICGGKDMGESQGVEKNVEGEGIGREKREYRDTEARKI